MPTPVAQTALISAAGNKTLRRVLLGSLVAVAGIAGVLATPLALFAVSVVAPAAAAPAQETGSGVPAPSGEWGMPLAGDFTKGRGFGHNLVIGCAYCSVDHQGYDMSQGCGSTIYAAGAGTVITAGSYQGYGNTVRIDHGDRLVTLYGHMQWGSLRVQAGDTVTAGSPLGAEGNTGRSFGCHLHYEVTDDGSSIDPSPFMASLGLPLP